MSDPEDTGSDPEDTAGDPDTAAADAGGEAVFEATVSDGVCRLRRPGTRFLSSGWDGGESRADAAFNVTVPEGWPETDLDAYVEARLDRAGFSERGPTLMTGVDQRHARRARFGPVEAVVTAGVSNPAALPVPGDERQPPVGDVDAGDVDDHGGGPGDGRGPVGTVNVVVGTSRSLAPGALPGLLSVVVEAKAATLLARVGVPGTTTDAVVVGCDPGGERERFAGSATTVGHAARLCVRDALLASLDSRYAERPMPTGVDDAEYGLTADGSATVSSLEW